MLDSDKWNSSYRGDVHELALEFQNGVDETRLKFRNGIKESEVIDAFFDLCQKSRDCVIAMSELEFYEQRTVKLLVSTLNAYRSLLDEFLNGPHSEKASRDVGAFREHAVAREVLVNEAKSHSDQTRANVKALSDLRIA